MNALLDPDAKEQLADILTYHVLGVEARSSTVKNLKFAETLEGGTIDIVATDEALLVNDALVIETDLEGRNGIVHVLDRVLLPSQEPTIPDVVALLRADDRYSHW